jgi:hypothetical protein
MGFRRAGMTQSLHERWAAFVARGGPQLEEVHEIIKSAIAREGYLSDEEVMAHIETALNRLENNDDDKTMD